MDLRLSRCHELSVTGWSRNISRGRLPLGEWVVSTGWINMGGNCQSINMLLTTSKETLGLYVAMISKASSVDLQALPLNPLNAWGFFVPGPALQPPAWR